MPFPHHRALICGLSCMSLMVTACATSPPTRRTETTHIITQQAKLPIPKGPTSVGPLPREGQVILDASGHYHKTDTMPEDADTPAPGHLVHDRAIEGRFGIGLSKRLELGLSAAYRDDAWTTALSEYAPEGDFTSRIESNLLFGFQSRYLLAGNQTFGLTVLAELDMGAAQSRQTTQITTTTILIDEDEGENALPASVSRTTTTYNNLFTNVRAGFQLYATLLPWLSLSGGFIAQTTPIYSARIVSDRECDDAWFNWRSCEDDPTSHLDKRNMALVGTPFAGVSLMHPSIPVSLHGQFHSNFFAPESIQETMPYGGSLTLRLAIGGRHAPPPTPSTHTAPPVQTPPTQSEPPPNQQQLKPGPQSEQLPN